MRRYDEIEANLSVRGQFQIRHTIDDTEIGSTHDQYIEIAYRSDAPSRERTEHESLDNFGLRAANGDHLIERLLE